MVLKIIWSLAKILSISLLIIFGLLYFFQERLLFLPEKLAANHKFNFDQDFEELSIKSKDGTILNAVHFKADSSKGIILYLHGNAGSIQSWGSVASTYTALHYDLLMLDYRGYGKSEGRIKNEQELYEDAQAFYNEAKRQFPESQIILLGYSIGTGMASYLAAHNDPQLLILQAPYFNMKDLVNKKFPFVPSILLRYKLENNRWVQQCKPPIVIFHGTSDEVIDFESSQKLQKIFKNGDQLISLEGVSHNEITENEHYRKSLQTILNQH